MRSPCIAEGFLITEQQQSIRKNDFTGQIIIGKIQWIAKTSVESVPTAMEGYKGEGKSHHVEEVHPKGI